MENKAINYTPIMFLLFLIAVISMVIGFPIESFAADPLPNTCSDIGSMNESAGTFSDNIFEMIEDVITDLNGELLSTIYILYESIILWPGYTSAVLAAMILMISFYGISFMFGIVPATFAQALIRLLKIGILFWLLNPNGSGILAFGTIFVQFFYIGVQCLLVDIITIGIVDVGFVVDLINLDEDSLSITADLLTAQASCRAGSFLLPDTLGAVVTQILDAFTGAIVTGPLLIFRDVMNMMFSPRIFVIAFATFTTGPYGPIMGMAFIWAIWQLLQVVIRGLQVYVLSLVVRAILLGLAPIFLPFALFDRTKHLFMGWINQLISFSLQPVMLFAFLSFFSILITDAADDLLTDRAGEKIHVCYTKSSSVGELPFDIQKWSFQVDGEMYEGEWTTKGCTLEDGSKCEAPFPIEIVNILTFLLLTYIAVQMIDVVVGIASQISQGAMRLTGAVDNANNWFTGQKGNGAGAARAKQMAQVRK